ncbi:MAG TPA: CAP domain-containing protein [Polyangiaceae bacterium]|nr:CAP domain-containing protein [Polyangiaceae bacterium]
MLRKHWHVCAWLTLACSTACSGGDEGPGGGASTGGTPTDTGGSRATGGEASNTGGAIATTGGALGAGGSVGTGGFPTGGSSGGASGGDHSGGKGNPSTGGDGTGGGSGGKSGGMNTGGANTGGVNTGGANTGGAVGNTGGKGQAGNGFGGKSGGGASAGGKGGGASTGGSNGGAASGGSAGGGDCPEVDSKLCGMVAQHNAARANVMPVPTTPLPEMTWNTAAAAAAQSWADQCMFSHSAQGYGQNIYASTGSGSPTPKAVVDSWVSEVKNYNYSANTCSGTCGHYTQVVWRSSTGVGCGVKACSTNSPFSGSTNWFIVVCNYSPPGNVNNQKPY